MNVAYQEGLVEFRYGVQARRAADAGQAGRLAAGLAQPLLATAAVSEQLPSAASFLRIQPESVTVEALKPSADGKVWIVRLFGTAGVRQETKLSWSAAARAGKTWLSNLADEALAPWKGGTW